MEEIKSYVIVVIVVVTILLSYWVYTKPSSVELGDQNAKIEKMQKAFEGSIVFKK